MNPCFKEVLSTVKPLHNDTNKVLINTTLFKHSLFTTTLRIGPDLTVPISVSYESPHSDGGTSANPLKSGFGNSEFHHIFNSSSVKVIHIKRVVAYDRIVRHKQYAVLYIRREACSTHE